MYNYTAHEQWGYFCKDVRVSVDKRLDRQPYAQAGISYGYHGETNLISYSTLVCSIDKDGWLSCTGTYSQTTRKHIGSFLCEVAPNLSYYDAKYCYENDMVMNINTRETMKISEYVNLSK